MLYSYSWELETVTSSPFTVLISTELRLLLELKVTMSPTWHWLRWSHKWSNVRNDVFHRCYNLQNTPIYFTRSE